MPTWRQEGSLARMTLMTDVHCDSHRKGLVLGRSQHPRAFSVCCCSLGCDLTL